MLCACPALPWPPRVLIVEDERIIAMSTSINLRRMGCEVVATVPSGAEAIAKAEEKRPDVVLMDIMLEGGMDGIEAAEQIRQAQPEMAIIFCTAYTDQGTQKRARAANPKAFLGKPVDYAALKNLLDEL